MKLAIAGAAISASALVGGLFASILGTGTVAINAAPVAATDTTTTGATGTPKSNEDPTHEKAETAAREADEAAGKVHGGGHGHGMHKPNETAAHEAAEDPGREANENAAPNATPTR
jgi:hypothetical protein